MIRSYSSRRKAEAKTGDGRSRRRAGVGGSSKPGVPSSSVHGKRHGSEKPAEERVEKPVAEKARPGASPPARRPPSPLKPAKPMPAPAAPPLDDAAIKGRSPARPGIKWAPPAATCDVFSYLVEDSRPSTPLDEDRHLTYAGNAPPDSIEAQSPRGREGVEAAGMFHGASEIARIAPDMSRAFSEADTLAGGRDSFGASDAPAPPFPAGTTIDPTSAVAESALGAAVPKSLAFPTASPVSPPWMRANTSEPSGPGTSVHAPTLLNAHALSNTFEMPDPDEHIFAHALMARDLCAPSTSGSEAMPPPTAFRKFEYLNHRILLHLQDEITQLEDELRAVDEALNEARHEHGHEGGYYSDRDALRWRYYHIMGRLEAQLGKYYHALASCQMLRSYEKPSPDDVRHWQSYLDGTQSHTTAQRLERHAADMLCLRPSQHLNATEAADLAAGWVPIPTGISRVPQLHVASLAALFVLPMLLFGFVSSVPARLIVVLGTAAGAAALLISTNAFMRMSVSDWTRYGIMYIGAMTLLAVLKG